jgi:hypothetical protein
VYSKAQNNCNGYSFCFHGILPIKILVTQK